MSTPPRRPVTTMRGRSACAAVPLRRHRRPRVTRPDPGPNAPRGTPARWRARHCPLTGARETGHPGPVLRLARLKFLSELLLPPRLRRHLPATRDQRLRDQGDLAAGDVAAGERAGSTVGRREDSPLTFGDDLDDTGSSLDRRLIIDGVDRARDVPCHSSDSATVFAACPSVSQVRRAYWSTRAPAPPVYRPGLRGAQGGGGPRDPAGRVADPRSRGLRANGRLNRQRSCYDR